MCYITSITLECLANCLICAVCRYTGFELISEIGEILRQSRIVWKFLFCRSPILKSDKITIFFKSGLKNPMTDGILEKVTQITLRGGAVVARQAHNLKAVGSIPAPATNDFSGTYTRKFLFLRSN